MSQEDEMKYKPNFNIRAVMVNPVHTLTQNSTVAEAAKVMKRYRIGSVVVTDEGKKPLGIVTSKDIVIRCLAGGFNPQKTKLKSIMSKPLVTISDTTNILKVLDLMVNRDIRRIGVVREGKLVGIVTVSDILKAVPALYENMMKEVMLAESEPNVTFYEGYCESCMEWSDQLTLFEGRLVCPECREALGGGPLGVG